LINDAIDNFFLPMVLDADPQGFLECFRFLSMCSLSQRQPSVDAVRNFIIRGDWQWSYLPHSRQYQVLNRIENVRIGTSRSSWR
jgi:hypothetical protein